MFLNILLVALALCVFSQTLAFELDANCYEHVQSIDELLGAGNDCYADIEKDFEKNYDDCEEATLKLSIVQMDGIRGLLTEKKTCLTEGYECKSTNKREKRARRKKPKRKRKGKKGKKKKGKKNGKKKQNNNNKKKQNNNKKKQQNKNKNKNKKKKATECPASYNVVSNDPISGFPIDKVAVRGERCTEFLKKLQEYERFPVVTSTCRDNIARCIPCVEGIKKAELKDMEYECKEENTYC